MTNSSSLPLPPGELRALVGPQDDQDYDNPTGRPIYPDLLPEAYQFVFDFGCGCGRLARQLIQQTPRPGRYVGIDPHRGMIDWAAANLSPAAPGFEFRHHDVYSPGYAPGNKLRLADRFPVGDGCATLVIAHSVFTHLSLDQTVYYLAEVARVLSADGVAFTSWLFFDNPSFSFLLDGPHALYVDEKCFSTAVLYDRHWFVWAIRRVGLMVLRTRPPGLPGHQWEVWLGRRTESGQDRFPLGEDGAEFVCGATCRPMAAAPADPELVAYAKTGHRQGEVLNPQAIVLAEPALPAPLAELAAARREIEMRLAELAAARREIEMRLAELAAARREIEMRRKRAIGYSVARRLVRWAGWRS